MWRGRDGSPSPHTQRGPLLAACLSLLPAQQGGVSPLPGKQQWWPGNRLWATASQWPRGKQVDGEGQEVRLRGELVRGPLVGGGGVGLWLEQGRYAHSPLVGLASST